MSGQDACINGEAGLCGNFAWDRHGDAGRRAVIGLHGVPGGRRDAVPPVEVLDELCIQYVTFDRPGYGGSARREGRTVASVSADIQQVADAAGLDRFAVVGGSGGSAHALAAACLLSDRVDSVTLVVPTAPRVGDPSMGDEAWFDGMDRDMAGIHQLAINDPAALRSAASAAMGDAAAEGIDGLVDDLISLHRGWGFDLRDVVCPVAIWYGTDDANAPASQALWLAKHLPHVTLHPQDGDHSWPATRMEDIFSAIAIKRP